MVKLVRPRHRTCIPARHGWTSILISARLLTSSQRMDLRSAKGRLHSRCISSPRAGMGHPRSTQDDKTRPQKIIAPRPSPRLPVRMQRFAVLPPLSSPHKLAAPIALSAVGICIMHAIKHFVWTSALAHACSLRARSTRSLQFRLPCMQISRVLHKICELTAQGRRAVCKIPMRAYAPFYASHASFHALLAS